MKWLPLIAISLLIGCTQDDAAPIADAAPTAPVQAVAEEQGPADDSTNNDPVAEIQSIIPGLQFNTAFEVVESRIYSSQNGHNDRQGFTLEYSDGDAESVMSDIRTSFLAIGYEAREADATNENGVLKQNFVKKGPENPNPSVAVHPKGDSGKGKVWMSWRIPEATAATTTD